MTDNAFPYRVCGGQQDSGSACVASRGNDGQITFRDWHPVGVEEYGYVAPDPLDPDIVYGGKVTRYDRRTGQVSDVGPVRRSAAARPPAGRPATAPCARSRSSSRPSIRARCSTRNNVLWKTIDGGHQLDADQPGPDARDVGRAEERRHVHRRACSSASAARSARR